MNKNTAEKILTSIDRLAELVAKHRDEDERLEAILDALEQAESEAVSILMELER